MSGLELLARSESLGIYRCPRGCLHVRVGSVTLNLTSVQFWELVACVGDASVRLAVREVVDAFVSGDTTATERGVL